MVRAEERATGSNIPERLERLPFSRWHGRLGAVVGATYFFDAFDALLLAVTLPALIPAWRLTPLQVGLLIASANLGQTVGSLLIGRLGDRFGRLQIAPVAVAVFSALSLLAAFSPSAHPLMAIRLLQGVALGAAIPVLQTYMIECTPSRFRGRFISSFQTLFTVGVVGVGLIASFVVPTFGWRWMFAIGFLPILLVIPLRLLIPESPRWLISRGRNEQAEQVMSKIEGEVSRGGRRPLPEPANAIDPGPVVPGRVADLFVGVYLRRTLVIWSLWFFLSVASYGVVNWLPAIYSSKLGMGVGEALRFNFVTNLGAILGCLACALLIDRLGRKRLLLACLGVATAALLALCFMERLPHVALQLVVTCVFVSLSPAVLVLATFTGENYPTALRARAMGLGNAWQRLAAVVGPVLIGWVMQAASLGAVFTMLAASTGIAVVICLFGAVETLGRKLEDFSPWPPQRAPRPRPAVGPASAP